MSVWARHRGVALVSAQGVPGDAGIAHALADGLERGYSGELPTLDVPDAEFFAVRAGGATVGLLGVAQGSPTEDAATFVVIAIAPQQRGHAYGARALLAAERRLRREGVRDFYAVVPRSNGRGLYFLLRAGYSPSPGQPERAQPWDCEIGLTWFRAAGLRETDGE